MRRAESFLLGVWSLLHMKGSLATEPKKKKAWQGLTWTPNPQDVIVPFSLFCCHCRFGNFKDVGALTRYMLAAKDCVPTFWYGWVLISIIVHVL